VLGIAGSGSDPGGEDFVHAPQILCRELDFQRRDIFFQVLAALGAGDGDNIVSLCDNPGESELSAVQFFFCARDLMALASLRFFFSASSWNRGLLRRQSFSPRSSTVVIAQVRKPRPSVL